MKKIEGRYFLNLSQPSCIHGLVPLIPRSPNNGTLLVLVFAFSTSTASVYWQEAFCKDEVWQQKG